MSLTRENLVSTPPCLAWTTDYMLSSMYFENYIKSKFILSRFQSLDRRKRVQDGRHRANSTGALNFGYLAEEGIVRGSVGLFNYSSNRDRFASSRFAARESQQSIGQFSDHVDKYRDVAL